MCLQHAEVWRFVNELPCRPLTKAAPYLLAVAGSSPGVSWPRPHRGSLKMFTLGDHMARPSACPRFAPPQEHMCIYAYLADAEPEAVVEGGGGVDDLREAGGGARGAVAEVDALPGDGQPVQRLRPPLVHRDPQPRHPGRLVPELPHLLRRRQPRHQVRRPLLRRQRRVAEREPLLRRRRPAREPRVAAPRHPAQHRQRRHRRHHRRKHA
ncbi:Os11g0297400, partial [Oryza sativa Japonica Group]